MPDEPVDLIETGMDAAIERAKASLDAADETPPEPEETEEQPTEDAPEPEAEGDVVAEEPAEPEPEQPAAPDVIAEMFPSMAKLWGGLDAEAREALWGEAVRTLRDRKRSDDAADDADSELSTETNAGTTGDRGASGAPERPSPQPAITPEEQAAVLEYFGDDEAAKQTMRKMFAFAEVGQYAIEAIDAQKGYVDSIVSERKLDSALSRRASELEGMSDADTTKLATDAQKMVWDGRVKDYDDALTLLLVNRQKPSDPDPEKVARRTVAASAGTRPRKPQPTERKVPRKLDDLDEIYADLVAKQR